MRWLLLAVLAIALGAASCKRETKEDSGGVTQLPAGVNQCGITVVEPPPSAQPADPCTAASATTVFGPATFSRGTGKPEPTVSNFGVPDPGGAACVVLDNGDPSGEHRASTGSVSLDDTGLFGPSDFNENVAHLEARTTLTPGAHTLTTLVGSAPESQVSIQVRVAPGNNSTPFNPVTGPNGRLTAFDLFDQPDPFSPDGDGLRDTTTLGATARATALPGYPSGNFAFVVRYEFQIISEDTCQTVVTLAGTEDITPNQSVLLSAVWDGNDAGGQVVPDGRYVYRMTARLVRKHLQGGQEKLLDTVETQYQAVTVHLRLEAVERWTMPTGTFGPFGVGGIDDQDRVLVDASHAVLSVSPTGVPTTVFSSLQPMKFRIESTATRFAAYTPTSIELRDRTGASIASVSRNPLGWARLVPGSNLLYLPVVDANIKTATVTDARFYDLGGLQHQFPTPGLRSSRCTSSHLIYTTATQLVRVAFDGTESWRINVKLKTFEVSANGARLIGLLDSPGTSQIVHVDLAAGVMGTATALDSAFWNMAVAPAGRYTCATTKQRLYLFDEGTLLGSVDLPLHWAVSVDVSDKGYSAVGGQLASHDGVIVLFGGLGAGLTTVPRPADNDAYRPHVRFYPGGEQLLVNERSGLTAYDVHPAP